MCTIKTGFCLFEEKQRMKGLNIFSCVRKLACSYHFARVGTSLRVRGKRTTKEERIHNFYYFIYAFNDILCRILTAPVGRVWRLIAFSRRSAPKNTIRLPSLLITTAQE